MTHQVVTLQNAVVETESSRKNDQMKFKEVLEKFEANLQIAMKTINTLNQEKKKLVTDLCQIQQELSIEKVNHQNVQNELLLAQSRLENAENYKEIVSSLEIQREQLNQQLADSRANHSQYILFLRFRANSYRTQYLLQEAVDNLALRQKQFENSEQAYKKDISCLAEKLNTVEIKTDYLNRELNQSKLKVSELNTTVIELEQLICVKEDVNKQLEAASRNIVDMNEDRKTLAHNLELVILSQDEANEKLFEASQTTHQLRQNNAEQAQQVEQLTMAVISLRENQQMYLPIKVVSSFIHHT